MTENIRNERRKMTKLKSAFSQLISRPDPAILLLGIHPRERKTCPHKNLYKNVLNSTVQSSMTFFNCIRKVIFTGCRIPSWQLSFSNWNMSCCFLPDSMVSDEKSVVIHIVFPIYRKCVISLSLISRFFSLPLIRSLTMMWFGLNFFVFLLFGFTQHLKFLCLYILPSMVNFQLLFLWVFFGLSFLL